MRSMTGGIILASAILIVAIAVLFRVDTGVDETPRPAVSPRADARSARVEDRLSRLRADFEQHRVAAPGLGEAPRATKRDLPKADASPAELQEWRDAALNDRDPEERSEAILRLSGEDDPETFEILIEAMSDRDTRVRLAAVEAVGDLAEDLTPDVLVPALRDRNSDVRFEAVGILGDMDTPEALELVFESLDDPDEDVRSLAEGIIELAHPARPKTMQEAIAREADKQPPNSRIAIPRFVR